MSVGRNIENRRNSIKRYAKSWNADLKQIYSLPSDSKFEETLRQVADRLKKRP